MHSNLGQNIQTAVWVPWRTCGHVDAFHHFASSITHHIRPFAVAVVGATWRGDRQKQHAAVAAAAVEGQALAAISQSHTHPPIHPPNPNTVGGTPHPPTHPPPSPTQPPNLMR